jgi:ferredoxin-NADP reductase
MKAQKIWLKFLRKELIAPDTYCFTFFPIESFHFIAGQYIQITLEHRSDDRGSSRFFSVASAPSEKEIMITTKLSSENTYVTSFKQKMLSLKKGDRIEAFGPLGRFTLED